MEILYYDNNVVKMLEEGMSIPEFKSYYDSDTSKGKSRFKERMDLLWHVYSKSSPYSDLSLSERIEIIDDKHLTRGRKWEDIIKDKKFNSCVSIYYKITRSREDIQFEKLMDDIDKYIEDISDIPLKKKVTIKHEYPDPEDKDKTLVRPIKVDVLNTDERLNSQNVLMKMYDFSDKLKERIRSQSSDKKGKRYHRIFDSTNY